MWKVCPLFARWFYSWFGFRWIRLLRVCRLHWKVVSISKMPLTFWLRFLLLQRSRLLTLSKVYALPCSVITFVIKTLYANEIITEIAVVMIEYTTVETQKKINSHHSRTTSVNHCTYSIRHFAITTLSHSLMATFASICTYCSAQLSHIIWNIYLAAV